jgi:hypothetical protein
MSETAIIARVGPRAITVREFRDSYEFGPAFVKQSQNPKMSHLEYLINEKLIALDGYASHVDTVGSVRRMLREIEDDLVVMEWYRHTISPLAVVDSAQIEAGVKQQTVDVKFRYIFSEDEQDIRDVRLRLDSAMSFDSLYASLKADPRFLLDEVPANFFSLWRTNSHIADTLAGLKPGSCSGIIKGGSGFYLVRMDRAQKSLMTTATEYEALRRKAYKYYVSQALDSITVSYIKAVMEKCPPTIVGSGLKATFSLLSNSAVTSPESEVGLGNDPMGQILVRSGCDNYTVRDFARWYSYRRQSLDFSKPTAYATHMMTELIFGMVRDRRLIKIARARGYGKDPNVRFEEAQWQDKLVFWKQKAGAVGQPACEESDVKKFYEENKHKYERDASGTPVTYEQVRGKVKEDFLLLKYNTQLFRYVNSLKQKYTVTVDEDLLNSVHVSDEGLTKKVEVMILKKGGTLPRQAFPTIDNEWRFF